MNMDPMTVLKSMQGLSEDFIADPGTQQQMKSFWNMLDEMAANNPEEYSKFIKSNLESGAEDIKLQSGKQKVAGTFSYCIKTYTKGKKKIVLINFCTCPHVLQPLRSDKSKSDVFNLDTWTTIPASISKAKSKKSEGKKENIYFDAFVHPCVTETAFKDLRCKAHISLAVLKRLETRENFSLTYEQGDFEYFESYKGPNGENTPEPQFLELAADPEEYEKFIKHAKEKDKFEGLKTKIDDVKNTVEILTKENSLNINSKEKSEENKERVKSVGQGKVLIEEIKNFEICVNALKNDGKAEVDEFTDKIVVTVTLPQENGLKSIELDANCQSVKVKCPSFVCEIKFLCYQIRDNEIGAKWLKSKKKLVITCPR